MRRTLAVVVFVLALVSAGLSAMLVPPGEVPDELAHISRADSVVHLQVIGRRGPDVTVAGTTLPDAGVLSNLGLNRSLPYFPDGTTPQQRGLTREMAAALRAPWERRPAYTSAVNTASYPPVFYLSAAAGMRLAQVAGLLPWQAIRAARLCNAFAFALTGTLAVLLARRAHTLLAAALLLPMSLNLAGSVNQDGLLIAAAVLAAALLTRPERRAAWAGAAMLALVIAAKPVYGPLAGLLMLAPLGWPARAGAVALAGLPGAVWFLWARQVAGVPFRVGAPYSSGPLWPGPAASFVTTDPALQAQVLLHHPLLLLRLPAEAIALHGPGRLREMVGVLGKLDVFLPSAVYAAWAVALLLAALAALRCPQGAPLRASGWAPIWAAGCLLASLFAVYISQYLAWTQIGATEVAGVQGRYFIPLLPFLALALPQTGPRWAPILDAIACRAVLAVAVAGAVLVPVLTVDTYLLR